MVPVLAICNGFLMPNAAAQSDTYPKMAPVDQYLMEKSAETQLTQSAAPDYMSRDATALVLGRQGYRLPLKATTGFVCRNVIFAINITLNDCCDHTKQVT